MDILIKSDYPLCIIDFSSDLIELPNLKIFLKTEDYTLINTVGYYPHVNKIWNKRQSILVQKTSHAKPTYENINNIVDDCIYNEMSSD